MSVRQGYGPVTVKTPGKRQGRHRPSRDPARQRGIGQETGWAVGAATAIVVCMATGIAALALHPPGDAIQPAASSAVLALGSTAGSLVPAGYAQVGAEIMTPCFGLAGATGPFLAAAPHPGSLDRGDLLSCPPAASACVDLSAQLTWLQADGRVSYGPVRMEAGHAGGTHATPRGIFHIGLKAGAGYVSNVYGDPMPYAVFFGPEGIAFHAGSLTVPSHGCVHLDTGDARYYHDHLRAGEEVVVF